MKSEFCELCLELKKKKHKLPVHRKFNTLVRAASCGRLERLNPGKLSRLGPNADLNDPPEVSATGN